jgi:hypothetical protein
VQPLMAEKPKTGLKKKKNGVRTSSKKLKRNGEGHIVCCTLTTRVAICYCGSSTSWKRPHCARQTLLPYLNCHDSCVQVLDDGVPAAGSRSQAWAASGGTTGAAASRSAQHLTALRALLASGTHCGAEAKSNFPMVANTLSVPQEVDVHTSFVSKLHPVLATVFLCTSARVQSRAPVLIQTALASSCLVMNEQV